MRTTEILERLHRANYPPEHAKAIADILEGHKEEQITREYLDNSFGELRSEMKGKLVEVSGKFDLERSERQRDIALAKYDLVKWIVGGVVANGLVATLLKYLG